MAIAAATKAAPPQPRRAARLRGPGDYLALCRAQLAPAQHPTPAAMAANLGKRAVLEHIAALCAQKRIARIIYLETASLALTKEILRAYAKRGLPPPGLTIVEVDPGAAARTEAQLLAQGIWAPVVRADASSYLAALPLQHLAASAVIFDGWGRWKRPALPIAPALFACTTSVRGGRKGGGRSAVKHLSDFRALAAELSEPQRPVHVTGAYGHLQSGGFGTIIVFVLERCPENPACGFVLEALPAEPGGLAKCFGFSNKRNITPSALAKSIMRAA